MTAYMSRRRQLGQIAGRSACSVLPLDQAMVSTRTTLGEQEQSGAETTEDISNTAGCVPGTGERTSRKLLYVGTTRPGTFSL